MKRLAKIDPRVWGWGIFLSIIAFGITYMIGIFSGGLRIDKACANAHQPLDPGYPMVNWPEPNPVFPLSIKCNANYDTVPPWVNPALVIFALLTLACIILVIASLVQRAKPYRAKKDQ